MSEPAQPEIPHRYIAADTFNRTWELIDKVDRTDEETEEMIHLSHASRWHWGQVEDHTPTHLHVSAWQLSRVYASAGLPERARHFGQQSLELAQENDVGAFYVAYGHEALARAEGLAGDRETRDLHLAAAEEAATRIDSEAYRNALLDDLATIP